MDCQTCGEKFFSPDDGDNLENHKTIYTLLTTIEMSQFTLDDVLKVCMRCSARLTEIEDFRLVCLSVYQKLHGVKIEPLEDAFHQELVSVEFKEELTNEDTVNFEPEKSNRTKKSKQIVEEEDDDDDDDDADNDSDDDENIKNSPESDSEENTDEDSDYKDKEESGKRKKRQTKAADKPKKPRAKWGSKKNLKPSEPRTLFPCGQCDKVFHVAHRLEAHKRTHLGLKPFYCAKCDRGFTSYRNHKKHNKLLHSETTRVTYPCQHNGCTAVFLTEKGCRNHFSENHDPNYVPPEPAQLFVCDVCGKAYPSRSSLKTHSYSHDKDNMPFKCTICGKGFPLKNKLKVHIMRHKGEKNFTCPDCGLQKVSQHELTAHIRLVHTRECTQVCDICSHEFTCLDGLKIHVRTVHQGLKPYECQVCGTCFGKKHHLNRHMKSHIRDGLWTQEPRRRDILVK
ncbi:zinc finger protein ZFMSA12A-like isoform X1 [Uranotaenia lowii]|uniref:zinc finger protein ZFMSA12A-like isoform X1 n=1 Tax=Uranotaenia lowii TaxID=190385 RepID=UPI00247AAE04|nr:zinc finger protein ZFMSA12A-like isoform X1 [Uranotaenia lowii]